MSSVEEGRQLKRKRDGKDRKQKVKKKRKDEDVGTNCGANRGSEVDQSGHDEQGNGAGDAGVVSRSSEAEKKDRKKKKRDGIDGGVLEEGGKEGETVAEQAAKVKNRKKTKNGSRVEEEAKDPSAKRESDDVHVSVSGAGSEGVEPYTSFDEVKVAENILECCKKFERPSAIQSYAWPFLLAARDFIGIAATGSGKTLAFGVPAMNHVLKKGTAQKRPLCLVLAPTRELCQQIAEVLEEAGRACGVKTACVYGGASKGPQKSALRNGAVVVIATPGRLQDLVEEGCCSLDMVSFVVLDEADRMLDLGFEPAIRAIVGCTSKHRQTVMFSATWPLAVDQLAKEFMQDPSPIKVMIGSKDLAANHDVTQIVQVVDAAARDSQLESLLRQYHKSRKNRIIVFVLYKKEAVRVEQFLQRKGWKVGAVHGDKGQADRNRAVASFKDGTCPLLIATDVAARGLDIPDVEYVINYSFPLTTEDYVHRIGRTGRAGRKGTAHTFFTNLDRARSGELINVLKEAGQPVPQDLLSFGTHVKKKESKLYGAHFKEISADAPKASKIIFDSDDD